jgi:hypothetical protein
MSALVAGRCAWPRCAGPNHQLTLAAGPVRKQLHACSVATHLSRKDTGGAVPFAAMWRERMNVTSARTMARPSVDDKKPNLRRGLAAR